MPVSLFGVIALLFCLCYIFWDTMDYKIMENNVFIQDLNSAVKKNSTLSQQSLNGAMRQKTGKTYCQTGPSCNAITCSSIPQDSGTLVSEFIENNFKVFNKNDESNISASLAQITYQLVYRILYISCRLSARIQHP